MQVLLNVSRVRQLSHRRTELHPSAQVDFGPGMTGAAIQRHLPSTDAPCRYFFGARQCHTERGKPGAIGVDASEGMIDVARGLMPEAELHFAQAESLPLPDASVDLAFSMMAFHHWSDQRLGVVEVARVLRPEGLFYLSDISIAPLMSKLVSFFSPHHPHGRMSTPIQALALFTAVGLEIVYKRTFASRFILVGRK